MKRTLAFFLALVMVLGLAACGKPANDPAPQQATTQETPASEANSQETSDAAPAEAKEEVPAVIPITEAVQTAPEAAPSLLNVVGVFHGNFYNKGVEFYSGNSINASDQGLEGYEDLIVVFDYANDAKNRTLPASQFNGTSLYGSNPTNSSITLDVNGVNSYNAYDPYSSAESHYAFNLARYTGYSYPINYGNLLGGADPVRMFVIFYVNPNDLKSDGVCTMTLDDQVVTFETGSVSDIRLPDEIMRVEDDFEAAYALASFKWRCDHSYYWGVYATTKYFGRNMQPGSDMNLISTYFTESFEETADAGFSIAAYAKSGKSSSTQPPRYLFSGLPGFQRARIAELCPDIAEDVSSIMDLTDQIGYACVYGSSADQVKQLLLQHEEKYNVMLNYFGLDKIKT